MTMTLPHTPIPPLLRGSEPASFAEDTVVRRLPEIVRRVLAENNFDAAAVACLVALQDDLPHGRIRPLRDDQAPDAADWGQAMAPFLGQTWLEVPLFAAEMIFYRRILEATGYFQGGAGHGVDPYRQQKELGLAQAGQALMQALPQGLPVGDDRLRRLLHLALWANQADLSLWPVQGRDGGRARGGGREEHLVGDASAAALQKIKGMHDGRIEYLLDNHGAELCFDLLLVDALLAEAPRTGIRFHVKPHPCFVSDVIAADITQALQWMRTQAPPWARQTAERLEEAQRTGRLEAASHFYWASPHPAWEMPHDLWEELSGAVLMISKGDVQYRRWLGDARWAPEKALGEIIAPPAPLLLLRVAKCDVVAGLQCGQAQALARRDPAWRTNGQWGMIQFVEAQLNGVVEGSGQAGEDR